ncbi:Glycoside hydrolase 31 [Phytophthora palmivora]|uniref:Glycoside hydrolase 31 n=1 Tax=Phytophthora palmivora TaxID=4796 RepID=A0A2P4X8P2_9STRA|nr:Glycoside hydrolase 31 [Phytophthora palmivora]
MQADISEIRVYGVCGDGFTANSSMKTTLTASNGEGPPWKRSIKADYFAQSNMLVLSRLDMTIGQKFHVTVVAQPAVAPERAGGKPVGVNTSGNSGSGEQEGSVGEKKPNKTTEKKKFKFPITGIVGIVVGCVFLTAIILVFLLRRRRQGYETI